MRAIAGFIRIDLGLVLSGRALAEGRAIGGWEAEGGAQSVVLFFELGDAVLEVFDICGPPNGERRVFGTVGREVVVALAAALGGHGRLVGRNGGG